MVALWYNLYRSLGILASNFKIREKGNKAFGEHEKSHFKKLKSQTHKKLDFFLE